MRSEKKQHLKDTTKNHHLNVGEEARRGEVVFYVTRYLYYLHVHLEARHPLL